VKRRAFFYHIYYTQSAVSATNMLYEKSGQCFMLSGVNLVPFHCSLIYHFHTLISYFTQICPVDLILSIFSIYLQFH
jgi:hypothetical protein